MVERLDELLDEGGVAANLGDVLAELLLGDAAVAIVVDGRDHLGYARVELLLAHLPVAVGIELLEADDAPPLVLHADLDDDVLDGAARLDVGHRHVLAYIRHERLDDIQSGEEELIDGNRVDLLGVKRHAADADDVAVVDFTLDDDAGVKVEEVWRRLGRAARGAHRVVQDRSLDGDDRHGSLESKLTKEVAHLERPGLVVLLGAHEAALDRRELDAVLLEGALHKGEEECCHARWLEADLFGSHWLGDDRNLRVHHRLDEGGLLVDKLLRDGLGGELARWQHRRARVHLARSVPPHVANADALSVLTRLDDRRLAGFVNVHLCGGGCVEPATNS